MAAKKSFDDTEAANSIALFCRTLIKDVCFGPRNMGMSDEEAVEAAKSSLELVGIDPSYYEVSPYEMSGGQMRRAAIAGILAMQPKVLILDEPAAGLDPLEKIGVPVRDMAIMTMIAFRFIPVMLEEANSIMDAQAARGVEFENTSVWRKSKNVLSVVFPLFMNSIRRSADLAMAMDARGFSGEGATSKMYPLSYSRRDGITYAASVLMLIVTIVLRVLGV